MALLIDIGDVLHILNNYEMDVEESLDYEAYIARAVDTASCLATHERLADEWLEDTLMGAEGPLTVEVSKLINTIMQIVDTFVGHFSYLRLYQNGKLPYRVLRRFGSCLVLVSNDHFFKQVGEQLNHGQVTDYDPDRLF